MVMYRKKKHPHSFTIGAAEIIIRVLKLSEKEADVTCHTENVYNLSLHSTVDCDKINGSLYVRDRRSGDTVTLGRMNKKLKKLLCDRKVPLSIRDSLPLICDESGILAAPYIGVRDGAAKGNETKKAVNIYIYKMEKV